MGVFYAAATAFKKAGVDVQRFVIQFWVFEKSCGRALEVV
jgi:hypothetical protein